MASHMTLISEINKQADLEGGISRETALGMESLQGEQVLEVMPACARLRYARAGKYINLCSIINAKSGRCGEDCAFCAQSAHYNTDAPEFSMLSAARISRAAGDAAENRARRFSVVTSGKGVTDASEIDTIAESLRGIKEKGLSPCASPGIVSTEALQRWKEAGLTRYHHNLETARSFFPRVCTTHDYEEDVKALKDAAALGLEVCAGGIFGMGEAWAQRVELAFELKDIGVDAVPVNLYHPIAGTPLAETAPGITPLAALKTISLFRLVLPAAEIIVCGGRGPNLRELQSMIFFAGADGLMIGNYLTTTGRPARDDLKMIKDLELEPR
ncbi:MAG: biotin synthase BioB [bacterium]